MSDDGNADDEQRPRVPVTVLTGFLGAGKTTLLRYVLSQNHGYRIAVVQNEFAEEMGIESPTLVDGTSGEPFKELWELPNGCICCSAKDDFIAAIDALLKTPSGAKLDYIIVESVGLADPEAVIRTFWVDDNLDLNVFLDGVVTVVDMTQILRTLGDSETLETVSLARKQLMCADVVLCNKMDLLAEQRTREVSEIVAHLKSHNPDALYVETVRGAVDLKKVLSLNAFDPARVSTRLLDIAEPQASSAESGAASGHGCQHHGHQHDHHGHGQAHHHDGEGDTPVSKHPRLNGSDGGEPLVAHGITSVLVKLPHSVSASKLESFLASVLWEDGTDAPPQAHQVDGSSAERSTIVRAKGIFVDSDSGQPSALQAVGEIFEVVEVSIPAADVPQAKFLFLGYRLDKAWLHEKLIACA